ncbi:MAG: hypothetical protein AMXMBFR7_07910 [Planctomycetota bacterium]
MSENETPKKEDAEPDVVLPSEQSEEELKTLLQEVWRNTIAPHEMNKVPLKSDQLKSDVTIVTAQALPQGAVAATVMGNGTSSVPKANPRTVFSLPETQTVIGSTGSRLGVTGTKTQIDDPGAKAIETAATLMGPQGTKSPNKTPTQTARGTVTSRGSVTARGTTTTRSTSAKALLQAAKKLASISVSRLIVQEKSVVDKPVEAQPLDLDPEAGVADFEIERVLGEGGMGVVYIARQTAIDREIALKMIKPKMSQNPDIQAVFLAEAAVTGDLEHPNIVPIYDLGVTSDGVLFYAMKHAKGVPWKNVLTQRAQQDNIEILMKVADAVAFAHAKGIIHRDLKPENIMLGEFGEVLVMDWGLAACVKDGGKIGRLTPDNAAGGTPAYMAPEMATGNVELIGYVSDVYLLGAILYEIVAGVRPHAGKDMMDLLFNIATNKIQRTDKKGELIDIALKAMAAKPEDRYPNVKAFQDAIRSTQKHFESIALSDSSQERLNKALKTKEYEDFAQALFGFEEALQMWKSNKAAKQGALDTRLYYAKAAVEKEDLDLAASLIEPAKDKFGSFLNEIKSRMRSRDARRFRLRALTYGSAGLAALFLVGVTVAYFLVSDERDRAEVARQNAELAKKAEEQQRQEAENQRAEAVRSKEQAEDARVRAETARKEAVSQRERAEKALTDLAQEKSKVEEAYSKLEKQARELIEAQQAELEAKKKTELAELLKSEAQKKADEAQAEAARTGMLIKASEDWIFDGADAQKRQAAAAAKLGKPAQMDLDLPKAAKLRMVLVPEGVFVMGSPAKESSRAAEEYLHQVMLPQAFWLSATEVTRAQWEALTGQPAPAMSEGGDLPDLPVVNVSYNDISSLLLPKLQPLAPEGYVFRLPTEAEWEWACRAGTNTAYAVGDDEAALRDAAWFRLNSRGAPHPVAQRRANPWGLFDLHGNVSELCHDAYDPNYYLTGAKEAPMNVDNEKFKVVRGGSWVNLPQHCRSAYRSYAHPDNRYDHLGLRVALAPKAASGGR